MSHGRQHIYYIKLPLYRNILEWTVYLPDLIPYLKIYPMTTLLKGLGCNVTTNKHQRDNKDLYIVELTTYVLSIFLYFQYYRRSLLQLSQLWYPAAYYYFMKLRELSYLISKYQPKRLKIPITTKIIAHRNGPQVTQLFHLISKSSLHTAVVTQRFCQSISRINY